MSSFKLKTDEEISKLTPEQKAEYEKALAEYEKTPIGISQSDYDAMKAKYAGLKCLIVEDYEGKPRAGYFRRLSIPELKVVKKTMETDEIEASLTIFNTAKVWVDPLIETEDHLKLSMIGQLGSIMHLQNSYIKNF